MPYINIRVTKENGEPTTEQKAKLIEGVTDLVSQILGRNKANTVVIIDEIDMENYGLGAKSIKSIRESK
ncbi:MULTISPECIES: 2-hydroxymuconate tautomerase family protein [Campylobacter]|uniref:Tautomerase n=1 Tax=Campylobacter porcelli TaxID=1660073 RepID=A0A1X9SUZ7_9BACT|nr:MULTISPECIES: 4-oxalocrotonate tautomerase family protein [Campylobacter]MCR8695875.1 4-oxalocrotonate tautomerase family protein [Campylobacter sp. RM19073]MEE3704771.1 4-oxalocrotonate tautomerase family protein [Campylobacter sp. CX2-8023-23]MEE3744048.1 4-oxalocrotonate tautomerase family protein [Campylobacter sp. CX2-4855-23]MEE3776781.1 4-oxalocrotonate tautomerase family protein [Campylobacter sp. CX2-4080-23]ARR00098.1 4-oxalocrotonate tautomerase family enzyme [Campylobacter sp. R